MAKSSKGTNCLMEPGLAPEVEKHGGSVQAFDLKHG